MIMLVVIIYSLAILAVSSSLIKSHNLKGCEEKFAIKVSNMAQATKKIESHLNAAHEIVIDLAKAITGPNELQKSANIQAVFPRVISYFDRAKVQSIRVKKPDKPKLTIVKPNDKRTRK